MGHIKMMGATQPFISGAISKTVNVPKDATVEDIHAGLPRVAGGSAPRRSRSTATAASGRSRSTPRRTRPHAQGVGRQRPWPRHQRSRCAASCPTSATSITHKFDIAGHEGYITVGLFEDGSPGEIFLVMAKEGSTISGFADAFAQAISYALQYGVPLQVLVDKFSHARFEPSGMTRNPDVRFAKSIVDYIFRWMATKFLSQRGAVPRRREHAREPEPAGAAARSMPSAVAAATAAPKAGVRQRSRRSRTRKTRRRARPAGRSWSAAAAATSAPTAARRAAARSEWTIGD